MKGDKRRFEMVCVYGASSELEAEVVRSRLESEGIPAFVKGAGSGFVLAVVPIMPATAGIAGPFEVMVSAEQAARAKQILTSKVEIPDDESWSED